MALRKHELSAFRNGGRARTRRLCVGADGQQTIHQGDAGVHKRVYQRVGGVQAGRVGLASAAHRQAAHPARVGGGDPSGSVFDDETTRGGDPQLVGGGEEDIGRGLAVSHLLT